MAPFAFWFLEEGTDTRQLTSMTGTTKINSFLASVIRALHRQSEAGWTLPADALWTDVWTRIEYHGLPLLLHANAASLLEWPDQLLEQIAEEARLMVLWETTHKDVVTTLLDALSEAQIGTVIMKGAALAYSLHDDPTIRRRGDTDLLIEPRHKQRTCELLVDLGWCRKPDPHGLNYQEGWLHDAAGFFLMPSTCIGSRPSVRFCNRFSRLIGFLKSAALCRVFTTRPIDLIRQSCCCTARSIKNGTKCTVTTRKMGDLLEGAA